MSNEIILPALPTAAVPTWWRECFTYVPLKKTPATPWLSVPDLPALPLGEYRLGPDQINELLGALQLSTIETPHPLAKRVREHFPADALDAFGWKVFSLWQAEGAPSKEKWAFLALGFLGSDQTVLKLAPLIRAWPGEAQHQRAVAGLEVLRTIGTDTALMQINGIAQKVKFKGLKERAIQCMDAIAATRKMTRAELEDRIVPDCDLDARGNRTFDFGPRQFRFILGPEMKPMIRYPDGATKPDLPKPNAKDDEAKANAAVAEWKLLKKTNRRGLQDSSRPTRTGDDHGSALDRQRLRHAVGPSSLDDQFGASPGLGDVRLRGRSERHLSRHGDQTLADATDTTYSLPRDATVGVLHPLQLLAQPAVLEQWGQLFGDYEIVPPFAQLGRPAYHLTADQGAKKEMTQFGDRPKLAAQTLVFGLEKLGWQRGVPQDGGWVNEHTKPFYGANVTAVINYSEGFSVGYWEGAGEQSIEKVFFCFRDLYPANVSAPRKRPRLGLGGSDRAQ